MPTKLKIAYIAHSLRSDWNNGNAHFQRGLLREMALLGHEILVLEPRTGWSIDNLITETRGLHSLEGFESSYKNLFLQTFDPEMPENGWRDRLASCQLTILHEWNSPQLAQLLLSLRDQLGFRLLFHDTHHRASSSPQKIGAFGLDRFDGVIAFGKVLRNIYQERFGINKVWVLHEAADVCAFKPLHFRECKQDVVWIGNWGDEERSSEIKEFYLRPATELNSACFSIYGVRYPESALNMLRAAGIKYKGYLPNLEAPEIYASSRLTVHIPRREYAKVMTGIPTIRVFEALACGIPLISAPWHDAEELFRPDDFCFVHNSAEMIGAMQKLLINTFEAQMQAARGLETILARHTCAHRAVELTSICEEVLS